MGDQHSALRVKLSDLIEGIYRLLQSDVADPVNIGNPAELSVLEFARTIEYFRSLPS